VVVVAQTSYTATIEHLREFATIKAIGGRSADIYRIIAEQATVSAVTGFVVGMALAFGVRPLMAGLGLKVIIPPEPPGRHPRPARQDRAARADC
jgi:putative ABC transport system permease protein